MKLAEILTGPETWHQGSLFKYENKRIVRSCLIGAVHRLAAAEGRLRKDSLMPSEDWARLDRILPRGEGQGIGEWNDDHRRTWDEVASVVDAYDRDRLLHP